MIRALLVTAGLLAVAAALVYHAGTGRYQAVLFEDRAGAEPFLLDTRTGELCAPVYNLEDPPVPRGSFYQGCLELD